MAQNAGNVPAQSANSERADDNGIADIVVTAERRADRLQDVPIAITAATANQLKAQGVVDAFDIGKITPSFNSNRTIGFGTPIMRGVGSTNITLGDEPSVATYVDGFYQGVSAGAQLPFNNIERVEVLKGPQGTLYGRNATGGLINIITRIPKSELSIEGQAGYASYDTITADAYVTGGLADGLSSDLAVTFRDQGQGYSRNLLTGKSAGRSEYVAVRSKTAWDFSAANSLVIGLSYAKSKNDIANVNLPLPGTAPLLAGPGILYGRKRGEFASNLTPRFDVEEYGVNATLRLDLGFANLVSLSQYRRLDIKNEVEGDGTSADGVLSTTQLGITPGLPAGSELTPQLVIPASFSYDAPQEVPYFVTQELQLVSNDGGPFKWIVGGYYQTSKDEYAPALLLNFQVDAPPLASFAVGQSTRAAAAFAQGSYTLSSGLSFTGGVRYSTEKKSLTGSASSLNELGSYDTIPADQSKRFNSFTYRAAIDYRINRKLLLYATTNKGFKSGLFNASSIAAPAVSPETLYAYEAGFKADPNAFLRINGSIYYYDYKDLQTFAVDRQGIAFLQNAGGAEMYGVELAVEAIPYGGLNLRASLGLEHARYQNFANAQVLIPSPSGGNYTTQENVSGNKMLRTPEITGNIGATYSFALKSEGTLTLNASAAYSGEYFWDAGNRFQQSAYVLVDLSARFSTPDDRWNVRVWGKNVTDKAYAIYGNADTRYFSVGFGEPATYGVTIGKAF
ncbi:hypothetical protein BSL82_10525 [Tardibacter chloracetimidivorans]|uniref:TonB-dependent receptor n=1 Tax=Tardibacter chloracetimidivorans TaxID=1921510 RepID=A0A1L3ZVT0_9SPHN|nr:hypothetical protein BSL82_10525 [Tardibacter chloracetimidivorans]